MTVAHMADAKRALESAVEVVQFALGNIDGTIPDKYAQLVIEMKVALALVGQTGHALTSIADTMLPDDEEVAVDGTQASLN
jgi:hypothetical protein